MLARSHKGHSADVCGVKGHCDAFRCGPGTPEGKLKAVAKTKKLKDSHKRNKHLKNIYKTFFKNKPNQYEKKKFKNRTCMLLFSDNIMIYCRKK